MGDEGEGVMVQKFVKKPIMVEAVRFTGDNWAEMHAFTGHRHIEGRVYVDVFVEAGTYTLVGRDEPEYVAELWVEANSAWVPLTVGEWIMKDDFGFYPCQDDGTGFAPLNYAPTIEMHPGDPIVESNPATGWVKEKR